VVTARGRCSILLSLILAAPVGARAAPPDAAGRDEPRFELSAKAGAHISQVLSPLGLNVDLALKLAYGVAMNGRLRVFAELGYTQPTRTVRSSDPRLGDEATDYASTLQVRDFSTTVGAAYAFAPPAALLQPYAGLGLAVHFLRHDVDGGTSTAFGRNWETSTRLGGAAQLGTGFRLGPGLLLGELRFAFAPVDETLPGRSNIGALSILVGYGLLL
jgi:hypothetical protein